MFLKKKKPAKFWLLRSVDAKARLPVRAFIVLNEAPVAPPQEALEHYTLKK